MKTCQDCGRERAKLVREKCTTCYDRWRRTDEGKQVMREYRAAKLARKTNPPPCLDCGTRHGKRSKGLCPPCYQRQRWADGKESAKRRAVRKKEIAKTGGYGVTDTAGMCSLCGAYKKHRCPNSLRCRTCLLSSLKVHNQMTREPKHAQDGRSPEERERAIAALTERAADRKPLFEEGQS